MVKFGKVEVDNILLLLQISSKLKSRETRAKMQTNSQTRKRDFWHWSKMRTVPCPFGGNTFWMILHQKKIKSSYPWQTFHVHMWHQGSTPLLDFNFLGI